MNNNILFLTLRVFSATGGIEKVCKILCKAISEFQSEGLLASINVLSMYDKTEDVNSKYLSPKMFSGYAEKKWSFVKQAVKLGRSSNVVVLSHINLLSIGYLIKLIAPKTKLVLIAHGIEVWGPLSGLRIRMLKKCDNIIAVSNFTKQTMMQLYNLSDKKIGILNNCIDPYLPAPLNEPKDPELLNTYGFSNNDIILMTLTRLSSKELYKGYDHVLYAVNNLKAKYPTIKYLIVGRYDEVEKERLDKIIQQQQLEKEVVFAGYIHDDAVAKHYNLADLYVMPSKKEGFGIVFIEAMYYGLPVIAGNKDGSVDALCDGKLGILVNPDDQDEINTAIEKIILDKNKFKPKHDLLMECFSYSNYKENLKKVLFQA